MHYRNRMNQNGTSFSSQCLKFKNQGHKVSECISVLRKYSNKKRNIKCYVFNGFGHIAKKSETRRNQMSNRNEQRNFVCYKCNRFGHVARYCRSNNGNNRGSIDKRKNKKGHDKDKEKVNVEEMQEKMKKTWRKNSEENTSRGSASISSANSSLGN